MSYERDDGFGDSATAALVGWIALAVVVVLAIAVALLVAALLELGRVYWSRAFTQGPAAKHLWTALTTFAFAVFLGVGLAANPETAVLGFGLIGWSFVILIVVAEYIDRREAERELEALLRQPEISLLDVLMPWDSDESHVAEESPESAAWYLVKAG